MPTFGGRNASTRMCWLGNKRSMESVTPLSGRQPQMFEDLDDGGWIFNSGDDLEIAVTVGAGQYVDVAYKDVGEEREQDAEALNTRLSSLAHWTRMSRCREAQ